MYSLIQLGLRPNGEHSEYPAIHFLVCLVDFLRRLISFDPVSTMRLSLHFRKIEFLRQENQKIEDSIRKATSADRPFGSEEFLIILEKILERNIFPRKSGRPRKESL